MDKRVLKWITIWMIPFSIGVICSMFWLPQLHDETILAAREYNGDIETLLQKNDLPISNGDFAVDKNEQNQLPLMIELPYGVGEQDIVIENDIMSGTVFVHIPNDSADYFSEYRVRGSSAHIEGVDYYNKDGDGVICLALDTICEVLPAFDDEMLCLRFAKPKEIYDKIVVVDAGHGGRASGACKLGISEKDLNLAILLELKAIFDESDDNIKVYYTRTDDTNPSVEQRAALANEVEADLFISIHNNSTKSGFMSNTNGTVVMYSESDNSELSSKHLAEICMDEVTGALGSRRAGLLKGDSIYIIRTSEMPVALIEVGFMTSREELDSLNDAEYQKKAAEGIYQAILRAFDEGY